jgi:hypothetical protein
VSQHGIRHARVAAANHPLVLLDQHTGLLDSRDLGIANAPGYRSLWFALRP